MKKFIFKTLLILSPFLLWGISIYIIDPFNYFNNNIISSESKKSAERLNMLMYRTFSYLHKPQENLLIGDSRTNSLPLSDIKKVTNSEWSSLSTNAAKFNEIVDLFYLTNNKNQLNKVLIGVNFNMFNEYAYNDRVSDLQKMLDIPLNYLYNKEVLEAAYYTLKTYLLNADPIDFTPPKTNEEFWRWNVQTKAEHWYGKYKYPKKLYQELWELDQFAYNNNIDLIFFIVPHHISFHDRLVEFGLSEEEKKFKKVFFNLKAKVFDFNYKNSITSNKKNFDDPIHYNDSIAQIIVKEIFGDTQTIAKTNFK